MRERGNLICNGQYVIIQRKEYKKLHLLSEKSSSIFIGKDKVDIGVILGKQIGSTFKMIPIKGHNRMFTLELCNTIDVFSSKELLKDICSGSDNRSIFDDGLSQSLTSHSIEELRDSGTAPKNIIEQLVENSKTFQIKTEYSQEKYINKKEKKYFEYITVHQPNIRLLSEVLYNRDIPKSVGIRMDTLSQLTTALNFQPDGSYLLVESGFNGIVAATLLNSLSDKGNLIHVTPGNQNQKQAVLAMNFSSDLMSRLITIRLSTMMKLIEEDKVNLQSDCEDVSPKNCSNTESQTNTLEASESCNTTKKEQLHELNLIDFRKRKHSNFNSSSPEMVLKKPRWAVEAEIAVGFLKKCVDGLIICCKEFPTNILLIFLKYLLPSRPFIVYSLYHEPLVALYLQLKQRHDIVYLRITESWFRPYQVLTDRSHPAVTVSSSGGYLLSGIKVVNL